MGLCLRAITIPLTTPGGFTLAEIDLSRSFPEATPVNSAPGLSRVNGFGVGLYGSRDHDREQGVYVKTLCLSALFIPVFALRSYVVADANNGGWYFLARVPLSGLAKLMNIAILVGVLAIAGGLAMVGYTNTAGYKAGQQLAEAEKAAAAGDLAEAARLYTTVSRSGTEHDAEAYKQFEALALKSLNDASTSELVELMPIVVEYEQFDGVLGDGQWATSTIQAAIERKSDDPGELIALLDTVEPMITETLRESWTNARLDPLKRLVKADPKNIDVASELAVVYESRGETEEAKTLLTPVFYHLGNSEGARVLGQILLDEGELEKACSLLEPYTQARISDLQSAEEAWDTGYERAYETAIATLENGDAGEAWYARYDIASEQEQSAMVLDYVNPRIQSNPAFIAARERYAEVSGVVDVALDLGVAQLELAQGTTDPELRRAGLEQAEQTFLSVQASASDSPTYRLFLGQVYFWLGRADDGHELFNAYLNENPQNTTVMASVGRVLRQVGEQEKAVALFEQAYNTEQDQGYKYEIAASLASMATQREDEVKWLKRCAPDNDYAQASLKKNLGVEAAEAGQKDKALALYDEALALYDGLPENSSSLNNSALVLMQRFDTSSDIADRNKALDRLVRAVELEPSGTILLQNTAYTFLNAVMYDLVSPHLDMQALELSGGLGELSYAYEDRDQWYAMMDKLKAMPRFTKVTSMYERVVLLAPKSPDAYETLTTLYRFIEDQDAMQGLLDRAKAADPDISEGINNTRLYRSGHYDEIAKTRSKTQEEQLREALARTDLDPASRSAASAMLSSNLLSRHTYGQAFDADEVLALAESAWQLKPSAAARATLQQALCFRILDRLAKDNAQAKKTWQTLDRVQSNRQILAILIDQDAQIRSAVKQDPDMQRLLALRANQRERYPEAVSVSMWAITRYLDPEAAEIEAKRAREEPYDRLARDLAVQLAPYSAEGVWSAAWGYEIDGKPDQARKTIERYRAYDLDNPAPSGSQ